MFKYILQNVTTFSRNGKPIKPFISNRFLSTAAAAENNSSLFRPIAFYSIVPISQTRIVTLRNELEQQLKTFGVVGRIYIAPEGGIGGINCQMAVPISQLQAVKKYFDSLADFGGAEKKLEYTEGISDTRIPNFTKLRVLIKKNLVSIREQDLTYTQDLVTAEPHHLTPKDWHTELQQKKQNVFLLDMRNQFEYEVGHFDHAIKMDVDTFRDGIQLLDKLVDKKSKKDDIYMYCTGGIRCSVAGTYLRKKGYENVKMLKGGITAYGHYIKEQEREHEPSSSLFKGKNFTFDGRRGERITNDVLTTCYHCGSSCDHITNCVNTKCHLLFVQCDGCKNKMRHTCSDHCSKVIEGKEEYQLEYSYHRQVAKAW